MVAPDCLCHAQTDGSTFVDYVNNNKDAIYYCSSKMGPGASGYSLHYLFDPCGWGCAEGEG